MDNGLDCKTGVLVKSRYIYLALGFKVQNLANT